MGNLLQDGFSGMRFVVKSLQHLYPGCVIVRGCLCTIVLDVLPMCCDECIACLIAG